MYHTENIVHTSLTLTTLPRHSSTEAHENAKKSCTDKLLLKLISDEYLRWTAVSSKHDIPVTTIYGWIKSYKNKQKKESSRNIKELEAKLKDVKLENQLLKELLKKRHQLWLKD